jgi:hypothetical protein
MVHETHSLCAYHSSNSLLTLSCMAALGQVGTDLLLLLLVQQACRFQLLAAAAAAAAA